MPLSHQQREQLETYFERLAHPEQTKYARDYWEHLSSGEQGALPETLVPLDTATRIRRRLNAMHQSMASSDDSSLQVVVDSTGHKMLNQLFEKISNNVARQPSFVMAMDSLIQKLGGQPYAEDEGSSQETRDDADGSDPSDKPRDFGDDEELHGEE